MDSVLASRKVVGLEDAGEMLAELYLSGLWCFCFWSVVPRVNCVEGDWADLLVAFSGLADITLAILPWKIVWTVAINKKEKIGALLAMSMGVL